MIDAGSGDVYLPNGFVIAPALTLSGFQQSWFGRHAAPNYPRSEPWRCWFLLDAGMLTGFRLSVQLSFYEQMLVSVCLTCAAEIVDGQPETWLPAELRVKSFHDALLQEDLGEPDAFTKTSRDDPGLDKAPNYLLPWGKVVSEFDDGGGDAFIDVEYDGRRAQTRDEERKRKGEQRQQKADAETWMASVVRQINDEH